MIHGSLPSQVLLLLLVLLCCPCRIPLAAPAGAAGEGPVDSLRVVPVPDEVRKDFGLAPFYRKCILAKGLPIVGSEKVSDFALREAAWLVDRMLGKRDDIRAAIVRQKIRLTVMAWNEFTTDVPEHSDLKPKDYWDRRARGLGATLVRPSISGAEENLLSYPGDPYGTENILIHEFAHTIHEIGLAGVDPAFGGRLEALYKEALAKGLWKSTYAATNAAEYWAEGIQSWFDCNRPADTIHNGVDKREKLKEYDPPLAALIAEVLGDTPWRYVRTDLRKDPGHLAGLQRENLPRFRFRGPNRGGPKERSF